MDDGVKSSSEERVAADIRKFNEQFYKSFDVNYFLQKCLYTIAILKNQDAIKDTLSKGVKFEKLRVQLDEDEYSNLFGKTLENNLKTDISLAYYHSIETLFRLIFAHASANECPWVELTVQNNFKKFKKDVEDFKNHEYFNNHEAGVNFIFFGTDKKPEDVSEDEWDKSTENLIRFLDHFARDLLSSYVYNSYKHGLAVFASSFGFSIGDIIKIDKDDALVFLSHETDKENEGYKTLYQNYLFTRWQQKWGLVYITTAMIESVISIGAWKFNDQAYKAKLFGGFDYMKIVHDKDNPMQPDTVKMSSFSFKPSRRDKARSV